MIRHSIAKTLLTRVSSTRTLYCGCRLLAKGDSAPMDSIRLPSQTSINEWEFRYDFIPKTHTPKAPALTDEAIKQDIAQEKLASVEQELFNLEAGKTMKVEANEATVLRGGVNVQSAPETLEYKASKPIDVHLKSAAKKNEGKDEKRAERLKYTQTSINPEINTGDVLNVGGADVAAPKG